MSHAAAAVRSIELRLEALVLRRPDGVRIDADGLRWKSRRARGEQPCASSGPRRRARRHPPVSPAFRSEEHTSELQSLMRISCAVFCMKKKTNVTTQASIYTI